MRNLTLILLCCSSLLLKAQIMDTTILNEVNVVDERPPDERTRVEGKDIKFTTGAEGGVEGVLKTFAGVSSRNERS